MKNLQKYHGIIPAFFACYNDDGTVSAERTKSLAAHAESVGADAIAAIPPIYFRLPEKAIAKYWNDISSAAPKTDFIIYNIPQLAGVSLTMSLLKEMRKNPRVIGVKNSSMPTQDIQMFKNEGKYDIVIFNGPDEQFVAGRVIGAEGGIGGTYCVMPELFIELDGLIKNCEMEKATALRHRINEIIYAMCDCDCSMYAAAKYVLSLQGVECGSVRPPFMPLREENKHLAVKVKEMIDKAKADFPLCL